MTQDRSESTTVDVPTQRRVNHIVAVFNTLDIDAIVALFSENAVVAYTDCPPLHGRDALRAFIEPRYADLVDYRLTKRVRLQQQAWVGIEGEALYRLRSEGPDGRQYRTRLFEFLEFRDDLISRWDYVGNTSLVPINA